MGWVRLDDNFADHPKVIALSDSAFRTYITMLCYSNRQLTDGYIPNAVYDRMGVAGDSVELVGADLWELSTNGWQIRSYTEYQPTREKVNEKRDQARERLRKYRERNADETQDETRFGNANETPPPTQPNPTQPNPNKDITTYLQESNAIIPLPRVRSAKAAVEKISDTLAEARRTGINSWNLSKLVEAEWDKLQEADDFTGAAALTVWYVCELQSRKLESSEIARINQMTKRFGRISLLAIDEAASKDLDDLVSYAFRVAQRMYETKKAQS